MIKGVHTMFYSSDAPGLRTFVREKLKMMQLEDDSKLGHSPVTGPRSALVAIQPPAGFGRDIWEELAQKGFLTHEGGGMYKPTGKNL